MISGSREFCFAVITEPPEGAQRDQQGWRHWCARLSSSRQGSQIQPFGARQASSAWWRPAAETEPGRMTALLPAPMEPELPRPPTEKNELPKTLWARQSDRRLPIRCVVEGEAYGRFTTIDRYPGSQSQPAVKSSLS